MKKSISSLLLQALTAALCFTAATTFSAAYAATLVAQTLDKDGKPMPDAVIYAVPLNGKAPALQANVTAQVLQEGMEFKPYVSVVQTGTPVTFLNKDPHEHHIKSFGPAKEFEFKITDASKLPPVVFDKAGSSVIVCYLHGWMRGHILTVDTPWFAKTDSQGLGRIGDLAPGEYELRAWHPDTLAAPLMFKITADNPTPLVIKFDHVPRKRRTPPAR